MASSHEKDKHTRKGLEARGKGETNAAISQSAWDKNPREGVAIRQHGTSCRGRDETHEAMSKSARDNAAISKATCGK